MIKIKTGGIIVNSRADQRGEGRNRLKGFLSLFIVFGLTVGQGGFAHADENAQLTVKAPANVSIRMYGFIENDVINDSTQGFTEEMDNNLVAKANTYAGQHHRTIMS